MKHSHLVEKALTYIMEELKANPEKNLVSLCDDAGARFNLSPVEVDSLERIFKEEYETLQQKNN